MKNLKNVGMLIIMSSFLYLSEESTFSQGTDSRTLLSKQRKFYVGALVNFSSTNIECQNYLNLDAPGSKGKIAPGGIIDFGWFFKPFAGLSLGAGFGSYSQSLVLDSYQTSLPQIDSENEAYELQISGNSILEEQKITDIVFPVTLVLRIQMTEKLGFFAKGGIQFEIPVVKRFTGSGIFTYDGYYPEYPVLLHELPEYGFASNLETDVSGEIPVKSFNMSMVVSGGVSMNVGQKMQLILSASLTKSISDISAQQPNPQYRITTAANEYHSIMECSQKPGVKSLGFGFGLRYFLDKN